MNGVNDIPVAPYEERLSKRNLWSYSLGGIGRDMMYQLFNTYMLTCILLTKGVTTKEFSIVGIIIICCRIFDALNDPIMGSIIEITRTKWGKFKPWIMIGAITNSVLVFFMFWTPLKGMNFIIFFAIAYIFWSITFTMNDISYWSMLPSLATHPDDRNRLSALANLLAGIGAGIAVIIIPTLTVGKYALGGSAVKAFPIIALIFGAIFIGCQLMTCICVKEKPLPKRTGKVRNPLKQMWEVIKGNDQLQWTAIVMLIYNLGSAILGGLSTWFVYFKFGYAGAMVSLFGIITGVSGGIMIFYPMLAKKFSRNTIVKIAYGMVFLGYGSMLLMGLFVNNFYAIAACGLFYSLGQSVLYMVQTITIANSVEYNEWKTGEREEGIIFSIRPLMAKMGSALQMAVVTAVLSILKIADITNQISEQENLTEIGAITVEQKLLNIEAIIGAVPESTTTWLLICMTVLPIIFIGVSVFILLKKCTITEAKYDSMREDIAAKRMALSETDSVGAGEVDQLNEEK